MKTVVGLYEDFIDAQAAIKDLVDSGFDRADINVIASDRETYRTDTTTAADIDDDLITDTNQLGEDVAAGMATGGVIGGLGGLLLIAGVVMIVNLIVDLLYGLTDPRIRYRN